MSAVPSLTLTGGTTIPQLGFGTYQVEPAETVEVVTTALEAGYRHVDTAQMYGNEAEVGAALHASGLPRDKLFVTTKIWPDRFRSGALQAAAAASLERLKLDAVDLLLLHWPNRDVPLAETMAALDEVAGRGWARHVGVSNFTAAMIDEAAGLSRTPLAVNQVEYHPYLSQRAVLEACRRRGMALTAYCPLARGRVFHEPLLTSIAARHGKSAGQVALRWLVQQPGVVAIPRSGRPENMRANFAIFDFELSDAEMAGIAELGSPKGRLVDGGFAPDWDAA